jgi:hypothetical protein
MATLLMFRLPSPRAVAKRPMIPGCSTIRPGRARGLGRPRQGQRRCLMGR